MPMQKGSRFKGFPSLFVGAVLYQALVVTHELVHLAIYNYFNIAARIEIGLFCGQVVSDIPISAIPTDTYNFMMLAHAANEIALVPSTFLLLIAVFMFYIAVEKGWGEKQ